MKLYALFLFFYLFWSALLQAQVQAVPTPRTALLMGVDAYDDPTFPALPSTAVQNDIDSMKRVLESLGFEVTVVRNPNLTQAKNAVDAFGAALKTRGGASLFYFTGHGAEHEGVNFLVPAGTNVVEGADLQTEALSANRILARMESAGTKVNLLFLDCCRNPLVKSGGDGPGLAAMTARGALIGFATRSGDVAETTRLGSPYTKALVARLATPAISLPDMHSLVTADLAAAGEKQRPGSYVDLGGIFQMLPGSAGVPPANSTPSNAGRMPALPTLPDPVAPASSETATKERPFINNLGMKFVPAVTYKDGKKVLFGVWETRVRDFTAFIEDTNHDMTSGEQPYILDSDGWQQRSGFGWQKPGFAQTPEHPVTCVSWEDAKAFCAWLTRRERAAGRIGAADEYRLPTDVEWSYAVGIGEQEDAAKSPREKHANIPEVYPWGTGFLPPSGAGNYAGSEAKTSTWPSDFSVIEGYQDGQARTSAVGSFAANRLGIHDMGGNVWEWCEDWYDSEQKYRVLRGGSWRNFAASALLSSFRFSVLPGDRYDGLGFRCVLVVGGR